MKRHPLTYGPRELERVGLTSLAAGLAPPQRVSAAVECPICGAEPGFVCRAVGASPLRSLRRMRSPLAAPHRARVDAYERLAKGGAI